MDQEPISAAGFPIVGVGASAGGVVALEGFFRGLPENPGLAIVVVTHLSPDRESHLGEIIAHFTSLPVRPAIDGMRVEPNTVHVLGADGRIGIRNGTLQVKPLEAGQREHKPIDSFFSALAMDQGEAAAGVVLSGGDSDGTLGVKAIKARGGLTMAQSADGYGPQHPDMPASAISAGFVDFALPVSEMGARLAEFAHGLHESGSRAQEASDYGLEESYREIYAILRNQLGHDFGGYKTKTFRRRVQRRMQIVQLATVDTYIERLRQEPREVNALFRDLLIGVTAFFRDADAFESLATKVIPKLFEGRGATEMVRVWVPGCATGEEVYSLAILMREHMDRLTAMPRVQIFATDIDDRALAVARAARYPEALLEGVSLERRERFFVADGGSFVVSKDVRDVCIFSPHSVIRDPPFSRINLVSCRNLLIYFGQDVQNQVLPIFHYALRPDGFLFLGTSESIGQFGEFFTPLDKKQRIFRRRAIDLPGIHLTMRCANLRVGAPEPSGAPRRTLSSLALRQMVEAQVIERHAPAFVVTSREGDVAYFSGRTGKYLEAAPGMPTRQLMALARKGLRLDLRTALRESAETGGRARREGVMVEGPDGRVQMVTVTIERLQDADRDDPMFLVLFEDQGASLDPAALTGNATAQDGAVAHLEAELREMRDRLQSLVEEYETALEELKSSNEELVSVNEELQSANEELEASKEEHQSVNEELQTVNVELNTKIEALDLANGDLRNMFESSNVATLFLDSDLAIRSFTPAVAKVFHILAGDRGRPITDLATRFVMPDLVADVARVLASDAPIERRVRSQDGDAHYLVRISPYRDEGRENHGVVVSVIDVTGLVRAESRHDVLIAELRHRTRNLLTVVQAIATLTLNKGGTLQSFNERLAALGRVQDLVSTVSDEKADLTDIVRLELSAHAVEPSSRVSFGGPTVRLGLNRLQSLALAVHELATNAMKYGALSQDSGKLSVHWRVEPRGGKDDGKGCCVVLDWQESGVVMPDAPSKRGYGRQMIERALAHTLGAEVDFRFGPDGVSCQITVPLGSRPERALEAAK